VVREPGGELVFRAEVLFEGKGGDVMLWCHAVGLRAAVSRVTAIAHVYNFKPLLAQTNLLNLALHEIRRLLLSSRCHGR